MENKAKTPPSFLVSPTGVSFPDHCFPGHALSPRRHTRTLKVLVSRMFCLVIPTLPKGTQQGKIITTSPPLPSLKQIWGESALQEPLTCELDEIKRGQPLLKYARKITRSVVDPPAQKDARDFMRAHYSFSDLGSGLTKTFVHSIQVCSQTLA